MPLKWKIYYACSLYLFLWATVFFGMLCNLMFRNGLSAENRMPVAISVLVLVTLGFKAVLSIKGLGHYKKASLHSKTGEFIFIIGFCLIVLLAAGGFILSIFEVIPSDFSNWQYPDMQRDTTTIIADFSLFAAVLCSTFLAVFDLLLLKAIRKEYDNSLLVLGEGIEGSLN